MSRRVLPPLLFAGAVAGAIAGAACVEIATGPSGVASVRLLAAPPSIIVGDSLRDSTGAAMRLRAIAFGPSGDTIADAPLRFTALALPNDTTTAAQRLAVAVDSLTGAVKALGPPFIAQRARVAVRLAERLQVIDTFAIVPRPTRLTRQEPSTGTLGRDSVAIYYDCRSTSTALASISFSDTASTVVAQYRGTTIANVVSLPTRVLTGDSAGTSVPVRRFLVQYRIDSIGGQPASQIPTTTPAAGARPRPIIGIIARGGTPTAPPDNPINFDTTDATGTTAARLRVFPAALGTSTVFKDANLRVVVSVSARVRPNVAVVDTSRTIVVLRRLTTNPTDGSPITCAAP